MSTASSIGLIESLRTSQSSDDCLGVLHSLKQSTFPLDTANSILHELCRYLNHPINNTLAREIVEFVKTLFSKFGNEAEEVVLSVIVPCFISCLGSSDNQARRITLSLLDFTLRNSSEPDLTISTIINDGFSHEDWRVRQESSLAVVYLISGKEEIDYRYLIENLVKLLRDSSEFVVQAAEHALGHIKSCHADFGVHVRKMSYSLQQILQAHSPQILHYATQKTKSVSTQNDVNESIQSDAKSEAVIVGHKVQSNFQGTLEFGFIPNSIIRNLENTLNWKARSDAIEELNRVVANIQETSSIVPHVPALLRFLSILLMDDNFTVSIATLQVLRQIVNKLGREIVRHFDLIASNLLDKLGDNKIIIRQETSRVFISLIKASSSPMVLLAKLLLSADSPNRYIREEIIKVTAVSISEISPSDLDLLSVTHFLISCLEDHNEKISNTALETLALLKKNIGRDRIFDLLNETGIGPSSTLYTIIESRFSQEHVYISIHDDTAEFFESLSSRSGSAETHFKEDDSRPISGKRQMKKIPWEVPNPSRRAQSGRLKTPLDTQDSRSSPFTNHKPDLGFEYGSAKAMPSPKINSSPWESHPEDKSGNPSDVHAGSYAKSNEYSPLNLYGVGFFSEPREQPKNLRQQYEKSRAHSNASCIDSDFATPSTNISINSEREDFLSPQLHRPQSHFSMETAIGGQGPNPDKIKLWLPGADANEINESSQSSEPLRVRNRRNVHSDQTPSTKYSMLLPSPSAMSDSAMPSDFEPDRPINMSREDMKSRLQTLRRHSRGKAGGQGLSNRANTANGQLEKVAEPDFTVSNELKDTENIPVHPLMMDYSAVGSGPLSAPGNYVGGSLEDRPIKPLRGDYTDMLGQEDELGGSFDSYKRQTKARVSRATQLRMQRLQESKESKEDEDEIAESKPSLRVRNRTPSSQKASSHSLSIGEVPPSKTEQTYLSTEEIRPSANPEAELKSSTRNLKSDQWDVQFEALNSVRCLAIHHSELIIKQLHSIVLEVLQSVDSLRSSVSRNAIMCLHDLFFGLGRAMDPEVDTVVPALVKKAGDTSGFLCEEADRAITCMVQNVSESRVLSALTGAASHRNASIRAKVMVAIERCVIFCEQRISAYRDLDRLIQLIVRTSQESNADCRNTAKRILVHLRSTGILNDSHLQRILGDRDFTKAKTILDKAANDPAFLVTNSSASRNGVRSASRRANSRNAQTPSVSSSRHVETLTRLLGEAESSDWRNRMQSLNQITEFINSHPDVAQERAVQIFDCFSQRTNDGNSKVSIQAFHCLQQCLSTLQSSLEHSVATIFPSIASGLSASNKSIQAIASDLVDRIVENVDLLIIVPILASLVSYGNPRVQVAMLRKITDMVDIIYSTKPSLISKHVVPAAVNLLEDNRSEIRSANISLLQRLQVVMDTQFEECIKLLPSRTNRRLQELLS